MGDVTGPGTGPAPMAPEDVRWLRTLTYEDRLRFLYPHLPVASAEDHAMGVRVGPFGTASQCQTCGTVAQWVKGPFVVTHWTDDTRTVVEWERVAEGYFQGPPGDPHNHRWYVWSSEPVPGKSQLQDDIPPQSATSQDRDSETPPGRRPAGISAAAVAKANDPKHRATIPSRSPEARRVERQRAKRRNRASAGRL